MPVITLFVGNVDDHLWMIDDVLVRFLRIAHDCSTFPSRNGHRRRNLRNEEEKKKVYTFTRVQEMHDNLLKMLAAIMFLDEIGTGVDQRQQQPAALGVRSQGRVIEMCTIIASIALMRLLIL